jgi:alpha-methylacyl-CoA racemase
MTAKGPLRGVRVIEFAGLGPGPFVAMMLSDMGADVVRIDRKGRQDPTRYNLDARGRQSIGLDLKNPRDVALCLALCDRAELLIEGNRPGVMERLGLGPDIALGRNPKLVYGRMTGWGQTGPYASMAGHDINYLAISGALHAIGTEAKPVPPLNLGADYGGGAMMLIAGLLAGLTHSRATGEGQVVDAAMSEGAAYLMSIFYGMHAKGVWADRRRSNVIDGGAPFYDTYECADGEWIAIGAIEPQFYAELLKRTGLENTLALNQMDIAAWPEMRAALTAVFISKTRQEWCEIMGGTDVCFAPIVSLTEAPDDVHNAARQAFVEIDGVRQPAPAPRFSGTPSGIQYAPAPVMADVRDVLKGWGIDQDSLSTIAQSGES